MRSHVLVQKDAEMNQIQPPNHSPLIPQNPYSTPSQPAYYLPLPGLLLPSLSPLQCQIRIIMIGVNAELINNLHLVNKISITKPLLTFNPHLYVMNIYIVTIFLDGFAAGKIQTLKRWNLLSTVIVIRKYLIYQNKLMN